MLKRPYPQLIAAAVVLILFFFGYRLLSSVSGDDSAANENVRVLEELESKSVSKIETKIREQAAETSTVTEEERKNITEYTNEELVEHYTGTVIIGDSITDSIVSYEILGRDVVVSEIGLRVSQADTQIETAINLAPSTVILCFGANDMETYVEDADAFISAYTEQINKLTNALPDAKIFINSIFPIEESRIKETPALAYVSEYNEKLTEMCKELNCTYIDSTSLVTNNPDYYEPDGEHLVYDFYPKWLTYMAIEAGI